MTVKEILEVSQGANIYGIIIEEENGEKSNSIFGVDDLPEETLDKEVKHLAWANQYLYIQVPPKKIPLRKLQPFFRNTFIATDLETGRTFTVDPKKGMMSLSENYVINSIINDKEHGVTILLEKEKEE